MKNWIEFQLLQLQWTLETILDSVQIFAAGMLPRWLVYRATIRAITHGTTGMYGTTLVTDVRAMTILKRWDTNNE